MAGLGIYFLTSERLGFRLWTVQDLPLALALWGDSRVTHLIDARGQLTEEQVKQRLMTEIASMESHSVQYWPLFVLSEGEFVGCCGLKPYQMGAGIYELGVHLCFNHWGKDYATEACSTAMTYAFEALDAKGLFAGHHPQNEGSRHLLQNLGFRYTHDEYYGPTGLRHPSYLLTVEEFMRMRSGSMPHTQNTAPQPQS